MIRLRVRLGGFTLVEVMLTTVLAAVLLLALWSLLSMYSKTFEGGHARTEQAQLARVLLEQMSTDFQNVLVAPKPELPATIPQPGVGLAPASTNSNSLKSSEAAVQVGATKSAVPPLPPPALSAAKGTGSPPGLPAASVNAPIVAVTGSSELLLSGSDAATSSLRPAGLFGTATFLQIDVVQPAMLPPKREIDEQLVDPESPPGADELKTVIYAFEEYRDPSNPAALPTTRLVRSELSWAQAHPARGAAGGIDRGDATGGAFAGRSTNGVSPALDSDSSGAFESTEPQGGPMANPLDADPLGAGEDAPGPSATTIPEVLEFTLRYFDGAVWSEEWDSISRQSLPTAIEVSLRLQSLEEVAKPAVEDVAVTAGVDQEKIEQLKHPLKRLLIPLPLAPKASAASNAHRVPALDGGSNLLGAETHARFDQP